MEKTKNYFQHIWSSIPFWRVVGLILALEIVSYGGFNYPQVNTVLFFLIIITVFVLSLKKLELGVAVLLAELVLGSKGYLFSLEIGETTISIRLALFLVVFLAYLIWMTREKHIAFFDWPLWKPYMATISIILLGVCIGYLSKNPLSNIFFDGNGYLYIGLVGPATQAIKKRAHSEMLLAVLFAASAAVIIKTLFLTAIFPQLALLEFTLPSIYRWIRDTGVGEITLLDTGFYRIFFQSHIYIVFVFFLLTPFIALSTQNARQWLKQQEGRLILLLLALTVLIAIISSSRSFWAGSVATIGLFALWLLTKEKIGLKKLALLAGGVVCIFCIDYVILLGIINIPLPGHNAIGSGSLVSSRTSDLLHEPAVASRWSLVKPLATKASEYPILGSGLGSTVTYTSSDPRVLEESPDGTYTTFSFEWGYLDLLLKFGLLGFGVFMWLLYAYLHLGYNKLKHQVSEQRAETIGIVLTIIFLAGTHMFTPYLNHPLGLGWLVIAGVMLTTQKS